MKTQTLTTPMLTCNFVVVIPEAGFAAGELMNASPRDYGFDYDRGELAESLAAPIPAIPESQPTLEVDADEFETRTLWFLS